MTAAAATSTQPRRKRFQIMKVSSPDLQPRERLSPHLRRTLDAVPEPDWAEESAAFKALKAARLACWQAIVAGPRRHVAAILPDWMRDVDLSAATINPAALLSADKAPQTYCLSAERDDAGMLLAARNLRTLAGRVKNLTAWRQRVDAALAERERILVDISPRYWRLVATVARQLLKTPGAQSFTVDDLFGYGFAGLRLALLRYDIDRGFRFTTFAANWIRHEIARSIADFGRVIRIPVHVCDTASKIHAARRRLGVGTKVPSDAVTVEVVATEARVPVAAVQRAESAFRFVGEQVHHNEAADWHTAREAWDAPSESLGHQTRDMLEESDLYRAVADLLGHLSPRERDVVVATFGLDGDERTAREYAEEAGVTKQAIHLAAKTAMVKLRKAASRANLSADSLLSC